MICSICVNMCACLLDISFYINIHIYSMSISSIYKIYIYIIHQRRRVETAKANVLWLGGTPSQLDTWRGDSFSRP